ncbi:MAG: hypothetical protein JXB05_33090 [Myxococcaceae bacterium]|nr:hypothetical protein [Myxococcaceae bacterium]
MSSVNATGSRPSSPRSAVQRHSETAPRREAAVASSPAASTHAKSFRDEFVAAPKQGAGSSSAGVRLGNTFAPETKPLAAQSARGQKELSDPLKPFKDALDNVAKSLSELPDLLKNPRQAMGKVVDALKGLGLPADKLMEAFGYVMDQYAYNSGRDRLVQGPATGPTIVSA